MTTCQLVQGISNAILNPLIALTFALGLAWFVWGVVVFLAGFGNDESRSKAKNHMIYGVVGMAIMISAYTIVKITANTFGVGLPTC